MVLLVTCGASKKVPVLSKAAAFCFVLTVIYFIFFHWGEGSPAASKRKPAGSPTKHRNANSANMCLGVSVFVCVG